MSNIIIKLYHHANFDICHIYGVWENHNVLKFPTSPDNRSIKNMLIISLEYTPKQDYNNAKFQRSCFNGIWKIANDKVFF